MKTIFMVSRKPDFSACRLMTESALMAHGYICCGMYKVFDVTSEGTSTLVGEMNAADVVRCLKKESVSFRVEEILGTKSKDCVPKFSEEPMILYITSKSLDE